MSIELVFIIPLKSAKVSSDWEQTQSLLRSTLACVNQQPGSKAIVVCNERPDADATIVESDLPVPARTLEELKIDKMRKCHIGLKHAARFSPKRAMILDADDLVRGDLVEHVSQFDPSVGIIAKHGYRYSLGHSHLRRSLDFHLACASSTVFPYTSDIGADYTDYYMTREAHVKRIEEAFRAEGIPYRYLQFPAGIYVQGTNDSMRDVSASESGAVPATRLLQWKWAKRYLRKAVGRSLGNVRITDGHLRDFPGLAAFAEAQGA